MGGKESGTEGARVGDERCEAEDSEPAARRAPGFELGALDLEGVLELDGDALDVLISTGC